MGGRRFMYILVFLGVIIASINGEKSASPGCKVLQFGKKLQCRGVGLSRIPKIPKGIQIADFTDNLITHITQEDWKHLEKLQKVYLTGNPFHCDCNIELLRLKLIRDNSPAFIQDGDSIQCATPSKIHNKALKSLFNLCDITEHMDSQPFLSIQKRNAQEDNNAICTNTNGLYECKCKKGFYNTSGECKDIDECDAGAHKCDETTSQCNNTIGGHFCLCRTGFSKNQDKCVDIDECKETPYVCGDESNTCKNSIGSYDCICNKTGFEYKREARECFDTDECLNNPCGNKNMDCHNSQGSYSCECKSHYRRDGNVCKDIDECADKNTRLCEGDMKCINTPGSYNCECDHGYFLDADRQCKDRDECKIRTHNCSKQSYCRNSPGSFKCVCPKGYEGNAITKCSPNRRTRFTTPKYLLKDLKRGAWDTILVVLCASAIGIALLIIIILMLKKMCIKCANCRKKKELAYQDQLFYPAEMYDPDQMFFPGVGHEQMFYPDQMGYKGDEMFYPEGYPEGMDYPEETGYSDEEYYDEVAKPIPMASVDPTLSVPHTYYGDDQDDEPYYDYAEGVPYEEY
ncbi:uncharacterized protein LOC144647319 [Oculina patagonica]